MPLFKSSVASKLTKADDEKTKRAAVELHKSKLAKSAAKREHEKEQAHNKKAHDDESKVSTHSPSVVAVDEHEHDDDDRIHYDPEDDIWALEGVAAASSEGRKYARSLVDAVYLVRFVATYLGLFPLTLRRAKDGTYTCKFQWISLPAISYCISASFVFGTTMWLYLAALCISTNTPEGNYTTRSEEVFLYKRNVVSLVLIYSSFTNLTLCMLCVFLKRDYIAKQIIYWTEVVELLQLDVGRNVAKRIFRHLVVLVCILSTLLMVYILGVSPCLTGSGSTLYMLLTRVIDPAGHWNSMAIRKHIFALFIFYVVTSGYVYILIFFYFCRILTNILKIWNNRFQFCLHKQVIESMSSQASKEIQEEVKSANRTTRAQLFHDHLVIFNLIEGVNSMFEIIIESFYLSNMIKIVFEAYGFVHTLFYPEYIECGARQQDIIPIFLFLMVQLYMFMIITLEAAGVAEEAKNVLHIVRRKGMMTKSMGAELWFMLSMRLSFGGHEDVGIIGAGFFYITKSFLLGAISAMMSYFIIFYQFEVPYAQTIQADPNLINIDMERLALHMEGIPNSTCLPEELNNYEDMY